jgi:hypothetical protein
VVWLVEKELRELLASASFWAMLFLTGPLVGTSFISAVTTYGDLSGAAGTAAGVGEAFSPLIGVWSPTFGAYEIVAAFLFPFVAIRLVSADKQSGALKLEQQQPLGAFSRMAVKAAVLLFAWSLASLGVLAALLLWILYGGSLHAPELLAALLGHALNAGMTLGLAAAAAALCEHPATAAILTLGITVGGWLVSFAAAVRGGVWETLAGYTPPVMVGAFQHGLIELRTVLTALVVGVAGIAIAAVWTRTGESARQRLVESFAVVGVAAVVTGAAALARASWDASENRYNSFSRADEAKLRRIAAPLSIEVHLAPRDPRRTDLERGTLRKLRRVMPALRVDYASATSVGIFEQQRADYGEIRYAFGGRTFVSRAITPEGVLEVIYSLAGLPPPAPDADVYRGHPLAVRPTGAGSVFYGLLPASAALGAVFMLRRPR